MATIGGAEALLSRVEKFLKEAEASDLKVNKLGRKQLAYPIKKQKEAEYFVLNFEAEGVNLKSITDKLRLEQEDLLRYMVLSAKVFKPSKRKGKKIEVAKTEEPKREPAKVTVVTKPSSAKASDGKKVEKESKSERVKDEKKPLNKVDAKAKSKVASKPKKK